MNDYRFIRIIKYQTIHKEEFETYVRGTGEQNYSFKRNEMFYTAAGNQYLCPEQEYSWEPLREALEAVEAYKKSTIKIVLRFKAVNYLPS